MAHFTSLWIWGGCWCCCCGLRSCISIIVLRSSGLFERLSRIYSIEIYQWFLLRSPLFLFSFVNFFDQVNGFHFPTSKVFFQFVNFLFSFLSFLFLMCKFFLNRFQIFPTLDIGLYFQCLAHRNKETKSYYGSIK